MRSRQFAWDPSRVWRWIATVVCLGSLATVALVIVRLAPRSPLMIVLVCALAVLTMKLVAWQLQQWFHRWDACQGPRSTPPRRRG